MNKLTDYFIIIAIFSLILFSLAAMIDAYADFINV